MAAAPFTAVAMHHLSGTPAPWSAEWPHSTGGVRRVLTLIEFRSNKMSASPWLTYILAFILFRSLFLYVKSPPGAFCSGWAFLWLRYFHCLLRKYCKTRVRNAFIGNFFRCFHSINCICWKRRLSFFCTTWLFFKLIFSVLLLYVFYTGFYLNIGFRTGPVKSIYAAFAAPNVTY